MLKTWRAKSSVWTINDSIQGLKAFSTKKEVQDYIVDLLDRYDGAIDFRVEKTTLWETEDA